MNAQTRQRFEAIRRWRPRNYWHVWLSAAALPVASLIVGLGLWLIFRPWPSIDVVGGLPGAACYTVWRAMAQGAALRKRRQAAIIAKGN